jgi:exodeoxyribonuclease VII large subunit
MSPVFARGDGNSGCGPAPRVMNEPNGRTMQPRTWAVGALCRAVAEFLDARLNPVSVRGEISGLSRPPSGHLYFTLKDPQGQLRCAMFRRAASLLEFMPAEGDLVEVQGRVTVYEPRGDLQLVVESLSRAGQGVWYERFLRLKAKLEADGLFDEARKRGLPEQPRGIGLVTSANAAALHDVATCLRRRVPHVPVVLSPASVQGSQAAGEIVEALERLYRLAQEGRIDVILLARGGGSIEDLWPFNEEAVARAIVRSPVPVISGVGHETDVTIADFCADLRAPTPTAAAELVARPRSQLLQELAGLQERMQRAVHRRLDSAAQRLDVAAARVGRPSSRITEHQRRIAHLGSRLRHAVVLRGERALAALHALQARRLSAARSRLGRDEDRLHKASLRLQLLDPSLVLQRGYALLVDENGHVVTSAAQTHAGQALHATLAEGEVDLAVVRPRLL